MAKRAQAEGVPQQADPVRRRRAGGTGGVPAAVLAIDGGWTLLDRDDHLADHDGLAADDVDGACG